MWTPPSAPAVSSFSEKAVWDAMRTCFDPEIPVNIVDLGLIYDLSIEKTALRFANTVDVKMTLTAPGCGMGPVIAEDARQKDRGAPYRRAGKGPYRLGPYLDSADDFSRRAAKSSAWSRRGAWRMPSGGHRLERTAVGGLLGRLAVGPCDHAGIGLICKQSRRPGAKQVGGRSS